MPEFNSRWDLISPPGTLSWPSNIGKPNRATFCRLSSKEQESCCGVRVELPLVMAAATLGYAECRRIGSLQTRNACYTTTRTINTPTSGRIGRFMFRNLKFEDGATIRVQPWLHQKCFVSGRFTRRFRWDAFMSLVPRRRNEKPPRLVKKCS
jgi:hypothetical protein